MNYQNANEKLTGRNKDRRKLENNTYLERRDAETIAVRLHNTDIVMFKSDGSTTLDTGGWRTVTTKDRMNKYASVNLSQENGQWFVVRHLEENPYWERVGLYSDGMRILPDGTLEGIEPLDEYQKKLKLRKRVHRFAAKYMVAFAAGNVPAPGPGDCFYCAMREVKTGNPIGEVVHDKDHILSHIEENYFVPSLLMRAFETMPHSPAMGWALAEHWQPNSGQSVPFAQDFVRLQLQKSLSRYILRQLGQAA